MTRARLRVFPNNNLPVLAAACIPLMLAGCGDGGNKLFSERSQELGIHFQHTDGSGGKYFIVETLASGVCLFDYDLDGDLDIYFFNGRHLPPTEATIAATRNALYKNELVESGTLRFTDITERAGVPGTGFGVGGAAADYDNDGDLDLYVCQYGSNVLYRNEGKAKGFTFSAVTDSAGVDDRRFSAGAAFFDFDRDGDLDLYVTNYCKQDFATATPFMENNNVPRYRAPSEYEPQGDSFFTNRGDGKFLNAGKSAGIHAARGRGMGVIATDINNDGWPDIYVANDGSENFLWRNEKDGTFKDIAMRAGVALSSVGDEQGSMGLTSGDYDGDGDLDIFVTNYQKQLNALYQAATVHHFMDAGMGHGLGESCLPMVSWGTKFFDFDNDGWSDLFIANGHLEDHIDKYDESSTYKQKNQLFRNRGNGRFEEVTSEESGLVDVFSSRGAAFGDIDNDGDVDIVVCNSRERPSVYINNTGNKKSWVILELRGKKNLFAIGAFVKLTAGGRTQISEVRSGASYVSQNDLRLHFGLGDAPTVDKVAVRWPDGASETFGPLPSRQVHVIAAGEGQPAQEP